MRRWRWIVFTTIVLFVFVLALQTRYGLWLLITTKLIYHYPADLVIEVRVPRGEIPTQMVLTGLGRRETGDSCSKRTIWVAIA